MRRRAFLSLVLASACGGSAPELALTIREPADRRLFASIASLHLRAERDGSALAERVFDPTASRVLLTGLPYGEHTAIVLEGETAAGDVVARGRTCLFDLTARGGPGPRTVALSFAPTNAFAPTLGAPAATRTDASVWSLPDGDILVGGGAIGGIAAASVERYVVAASSFVPAALASFAHARRGAEVTVVDGIGTLVTGGLGVDGGAIASAELYRVDTGQFVSIDNAALEARAGHRAIALPVDRVLLTGGATSASGAALGTTAIVRLQPDGTATASVGPSLVHARRDHAAVVASGVPVLIGGYGSDGNPLASIEALVPSNQGTSGAFAEIATLRTARAQSTASLLNDGTILVVGGARDSAGTPLLDAEVYNPVAGVTTVFPLAAARRGHSATTLPDGRVLIVGGVGDGGEVLSSVELFIPSVGFVSERPLANARVGHRAIPLCDGTVLVVGGGGGAEVYTPPP